jgi:L-methionine (R)-S-oxide reductase
MHLDTLLPEVNNMINDKFLQRDEKLQKICDLLKSKIDYYDWVGFYFRNGEKEELILGPYSGLPTEHIHIPFGKGICGQVAVSNTSFLVPDVTLQDNYIACSSTVKSEIVVPLFVKGKNIGQIDIDSEHLNAFSKADEIFLSAVNEYVATLY